MCLKEDEKKQCVKRKGREEGAIDENKRDGGRCYRGERGKEGWWQ